MTRIYAGVTGPILIILGLLGLVGFAIPATVSMGEPSKVVIHLVAGIIATVIAITNRRESEATLRYAQVAGIVFLILGILGYPASDIVSRAVTNFQPGCNIIHLILGLWGIFVGFFASPSPATREAVPGLSG